MLRQFEAEKDPNRTVTLLKAVQWTRVAWSECVTAETIQKCFWKSTITTKPDNNTCDLGNTESPEIDELRSQIARLPGGDDPLSIEEFINPIEEVIDDNDDDTMAFIIEQYSSNKEGEESEPEEGDIEVPRVPINEAIQALEVLKLFTIQQDNDDTLISQALDRLGRDLLLKKQQVGRCHGAGQDIVAAHLMRPRLTNST